MPCENESFLCGCVCVCLPVLATSKGTEPGNGEQEPWGHQCNAGVRKKPFLNYGINERWGLHGLTIVVLYLKEKTTGNPGLRPSLGLQPSYLKEAWNFFHFSAFPKAWYRAEVDTQETVFPRQISAKISCYFNNCLIQQYHFAGCFINRDVSSALKSLQPT